MKKKRDMCLGTQGCWCHVDLLIEFSIRSIAWYLYTIADYWPSVKLRMYILAWRTSFLELLPECYTPPQRSQARSHQLHCFRDTQRSSRLSIARLVAILNGYGVFTQRVASVCGDMVWSSSLELPISHKITHWSHFS